MPMAPAAPSLQHARGLGRHRSARGGDCGHTLRWQVSRALSPTMVWHRRWSHPPTPACTVAPMGADLVRASVLPPLLPGSYGGGLVLPVTASWPPGAGVCAAARAHDARPHARPLSRRRRLFFHSVASTSSAATTSVTSAPSSTLQDAGGKVLESPTPVWQPPAASPLLRPSATPPQPVLPGQVIIMREDFLRPLTRCPSRSCGSAAMPSLELSPSPVVEEQREHKEVKVDRFSRSRTQEILGPPLELTGFSHDRAEFNDCAAAHVLDSMVPSP